MKFALNTMTCQEFKLFYEQKKTLRYILSQGFKQVT